ncbi:two-component system sensor histidine kinase NtrB [Salidesulfovibrio onnuriiensis]|uniref:two-component system sensor histidine kinase NtrB n=1 Tax=Salidesulfovibrio onnuriiensis TaxID=2583823 RepID=UPI0011C87E67|nr:ATP-binding protein [Salidesulfovibrio onnuriiensis]
MEIHSRKDSEQGPVVALVLALIVLGVGSLFLTWKSIARQRALVENNLFLSGGSIARGVESNLMRIVRSMGGNRAVFPMFPTLSRDLFQELAQSDDFLFIAIYDEDGGVLVTSEQEGNTPKIDFSHTHETVLNSGQTWHFMSTINKREILISGLRLRPGIAALVGAKATPAASPVQDNFQGPTLQAAPPPPPGAEPSEMRIPQDAPQAQMQNKAYLVIGLNADKHLAQFKQYRRAAMLQTGYVFLAAVVLWSLAFAYLRRRDQGKRLVRLEQFQNRLLDNMPDGLVNLSQDGQILAANGSAKKFLADPDEDAPQELVGRYWDDFPFGSPEGDHKSGDFGWQQHDFHGRQLEILSVPFPEGDENAPELGLRLILLRDRTRIRSLEEDLNEARRLAAIGSLAAGVAHEVRNPLSSLRGFAQFFATKLKGQEPFESYATTMVQESDRLNRVVTDLLYLARPRELAPQKVELAEVADTLKKLMRFDMQHRKVEPHFDFEAPSIWADPDALRQVLLNLIANSLDALSEDQEGGSIELLSRPDHGGVWVSVHDNGTGMAEDIRAQALEPFFTGKTTGTGLGLAIVHNIMRAHKGQVHIDSDPGQGTTIRLYFPNPAESQEQA